MRKSVFTAPLYRVVAASVLVVLLSTPRPALAWGNTGHEAVAAVAWKHLDQATKDKIFALLQQVPSIQNTEKTLTIPGFAEWSQNLPPGLTEDEQHMYIFMRAATWPDSIKHTFFHDSDTPPRSGASPTLTGFADRNSYGYWHFVDTPSGAGMTPHAVSPTMPESCSRFAAPTPLASLPSAAAKPNAATQITVLSTSLASSTDPALQAYDLVWLEHMVGDIHQPLHAASRYINGVGDTGGNCVAISVQKPLSAKFRGAGTTSRPPTELHAFWDDLPGTGDQMDTQLAVTFAATVPAAPDTQVAITDPNVWAQESTAIAARDAYVLPIADGLGTPKAYIITPAYYNTAYSDVQARIALAGARLANLLTQALNH